MTTIALPKHQRTGLSVSGVARIIRKVLTSHRGRAWRMSDLMQAVDPQGRISRNTLRTMIVAAAPLVIRQLGVMVRRDGRANVYILPEAEVPDDLPGPHLEAEAFASQEQRVAELLAANPRIWTMAEIEERIFPGETIEERRRHTSFNGFVARATARLGWLVVVDPRDRRLRLYCPPV